MRHATALRLVLLMLFGLSAVFSAHAEHEADHRYQVFGQVTNTDGKPISGRRVQVRDGNTLLESTTTDAEGNYSMQLHLHDKDLGRRLTVGAGGASTEIVVNFTRGDKTTLRSHRVDFRGRQTTDTQKAGSGFVIPPALYYIAAVVGIVVLLAVASRGSRRRRIKASTKTAAVKNPHKRRRKKRH